MGLTDLLLSSLLVAVYIFRYVAHAKLTELISELAIDSVDIVLRICFRVVDIQTANQVRIYLRLQREDEHRRSRQEVQQAQQELERGRREERRLLQALEELEQGQDGRRPAQ